MGLFNDKVALITGGARGLGAATARRMAQDGAHVFIADLAGVGGEDFATDIGGEFTTLDVTDQAAWEAVVSTICGKHSTIDVLVNSAGIEGDVRAGELESTTLDEWRRVFSVNVDGTFLGCRTVMKVMKRAGRGAIVNVSSAATYYPTMQSVAYGASKGAVTQFTKSVAMYGAQDGNRIRCNSVHPGMIRTRMLESIFSQLGERHGAAVSQAAQESAQRIPLKLGTPEEVANLIAFLASDESSYVTGSEYSVDGGWRLLR